LTPSRGPGEVAAAAAAEGEAEGGQETKRTWGTPRSGEATAVDTRRRSDCTFLFQTPFSFFFIYLITILKTADTTRYLNTAAKH